MIHLLIVTHVVTWRKHLHTQTKNPILLYVVISKQPPHISSRPSGLLIFFLLLPTRYLIRAHIAIFMVSWRVHTYLQIYTQLNSAVIVTIMT